MKIKTATAKELISDVERMTFQREGFTRSHFDSEFYPAYYEAMKAQVQQLVIERDRLNRAINDLLR